MTVCDRTQAQPQIPDRGYNLFRNRQRSELLCAVPEDYPVPGFIIEVD